MHNSDSECVQSFELSKQSCESLMNPVFATTALTVLRGNDPPNSSPGVKLELTPDGFFLYSESANTYIE